MFFENLPYNAIPVAKAYADIDVRNVIREEYKTAYSIDMLKAMPRPWADGVQSTFDYNEESNEFLRVQLPNLREFVETSIQLYIESMSPTKEYAVEIYESWINYYQPGAYQHYHVHSGADISGCYYLEVPANSGDLVLSDHSKEVDRFPYNITSQPLFYPRQTIQPHEGSIVLFPGWASHAVYQNESALDRVSFAFNAKVTLNDS